MRLIVKILVANLFCLFTQVGKAENDSLLFQLPPLELVLSYALNNSPLLLEKHKQIDIKGKDVQIEKRKWMNYLFIEGAATYGLYDRLITQDNTAVASSISGILNQSKQTTYYTGVGLKLPISALTNRNKELKKKRLEVEKVKYELDESEMQLRHFVIELYFNLKYLKESMYSCFEIYQTLDISYKKAKKDLYNGRTGINDFAILSSTVGKAKNDYLKAQSSFWTAYKTMESITGLSFNEIKP